jgi:hypothetical protein
MRPIILRGAVHVVPIFDEDEDEDEDEGAEEDIAL